jgi:hypothetical protein
LRRANVRYILAGDEIPMHFDNVGGMYLVWFKAMIDWLGLPASTYYEPLSRVTPEGGVEPLMVYYPAFYESMAHRLYLFAGAKVTPRDASWVVSIAEAPNAAGGTERYAVNLRQFATHDDARAEIVSRGAGDHRLVGLDPMQSPVPLDAFPGLRVAYDSPIDAPAFPGIPAARVFEVSAMSGR